MTIEHKETENEEIANTLLSGIGAALSIAGLCLLVVSAVSGGTIQHVVSFSIYGASLVILYLASTFYHALRKPEIKRIFQSLDHSSVYLLIAGTYTPFCLVSLKGAWGWSLFGVEWGIAAFGILLKTRYPGRFKIFSMALYLAMGWIIVIAFRPLLESLPEGGVLLILLGGLSYTAGIIFYAKINIPFSHAIWHLFVLGGSIIHFFAMLLYVLPN